MHQHVVPAFDLAAEHLQIARWCVGVAVALLIWLALSIDLVGFRK